MVLRFAYFATSWTINGVLLSVNQEKMSSTIADPFGGIIANEAFEPVFDLHDVVILVNVGIKDHANYEEKHMMMIVQALKTRQLLWKEKKTTLRAKRTAFLSPDILCHLLDKYNKVDDITTIRSRRNYWQSCIFMILVHVFFIIKISSFSWYSKKG